MKIKELNKKVILYGNCKKYIELYDLKNLINNDLECV